MKKKKTEFEDKEFEGGDLKITLSEEPSYWSMNLEMLGEEVLITSNSASDALERAIEYGRGLE